MEHVEAMQSGAAERYILGQLSAAEADSYEEHFFDCRECAEEVRMGAAFLEGGRKLARQEREAPVVSIAEHRERRRPWLPAAVAALLILGISAPLLVRQMRETGPSFDIPAVHTLQSGTRAAGEPVQEVAPGDILYVDVVAEPSYGRYELRVTDAGGKHVLTRAVTPEQTRDSLPLVLRGWDAGTYELVIVGVDPAGQTAEISRHRFSVKG
jgi:hypothetical protein